MIQTTNITAATPIGSTTYTGNPAILTGGSPNGSLMIFCATARDTTPAAGAPRLGLISDRATRTATTCFMRGISERMEIQVADGMPWQWRRICFTLKGTVDILPTSTSFSPFLETSSGYTRVLNQPSAGVRTAFEALLFQGQISADWNSPITAKVDTTRVTLRFDRTVTIASGNDDGVIRKYRHWHPMNKNLVYDDEEIGGTNVPAVYSTQSKLGMGDYIIADYFYPRTGATTTNQLSVGVASSLYWHEK